LSLTAQLKDEYFLPCAPTNTQRQKVRSGGHTKVNLVRLPWLFVIVSETRTCQ